MKILHPKKANDISTGHNGAFCVMKGNFWMQKAELPDELIEVVLIPEHASESDSAFFSVVRDLMLPLLQESIVIMCIETLENVSCPHHKGKMCRKLTYFTKKWHDFFSAYGIGQTFLREDQRELLIQTDRLPHLFTLLSSQIEGMFAFDAYLFRPQPVLNSFEQAKQQINSTTCCLKMEYGKYPDYLNITFDSREISVQMILSQMHTACALHGKQLICKIDLQNGL